MGSYAFILSLHKKRSTRLSMGASFFVQGFYNKSWTLLIIQYFFKFYLFTRFSAAF